ncbi:MAG: beta galactosidase jelly roll domain-containing protein [Melioribacteraceae bacterium]|nr:beta galactosidase jelly roll domain-containing protein [Melioribacteraceae bacterium]
MLNLCKILSAWLILASIGNELNAQDYEKLLRLNGLWKFSIGDKSEFKQPEFDDEDWEHVYVPASWEDEGFHGYDGFAWYRTKFDYSSDFDEQDLFLFLGYIDDVDEVYLNGKLIGITGSFPPEYKTAYNAFRRYYIPKEYLDKDRENIIAVRVYDAQLAGGILSGDVGIYSKISLKLDINLEGVWNFQTGDSKDWSDPSFDDKSWKNIIVPGYWEAQGYRDYDGVAWYRKEFTPDDELDEEKYVLVLGKIDDVDEVFINGEMVGSTGRFDYIQRTNNVTNEYAQFRAYYFDRSMLFTNKPNVISVRVFDGYINGGIYEGPVGIVNVSDFSKFWRFKKQKDDSWSIWKAIFGER